MTQYRHILPILVLSQFLSGSIWFAGNGIIENLILDYQLPERSLGDLTSAVQFGFIIGTLFYAFLTIADRYSPSLVFLMSAIFGSGFNAGLLLDGNTYTSLIVFRFFTGFFLAGIYPVGMKIAADYYEKGLGKSLGYLVGALVIGTAFPHFANSMFSSSDWTSVITLTSGFAVLGGFLVSFFIGNGPYRKASQHLDLSAFIRVFQVKKFRAAAFGYFGHMWELYAFWAFVPIVLIGLQAEQLTFAFTVPMMTFLIIAIGGLGCILGGYYSLKFGSKRTASIALFSSGLCCLISPIMFSVHVEWIVLIYLLFWGFMVAADSPQFSTLVAHNAAPEIKGTALTIVNCIGFAITIVSIQLLTIFETIIDLNLIFLILAIGPIVGLIGLYSDK